MRLKAPEGKGHPTVRGTVVEPRKGIYEVPDAEGNELVESHGYINIDAPPKIDAPAKPATGLRQAVIAALQNIGHVVNDATDPVLIVSLGQLREKVDAHIAARLKAAEDGATSKVALLNEQIAALSARAMAAEARVTEIENEKATTETTQKSAAR